MAGRVLVVVIVLVADVVIIVIFIVVVVVVVVAIIATLIGVVVIVAILPVARHCTASLQSSSPFLCTISLLFKRKGGNLNDHPREVKEVKSFSRPFP